MISQVFNAVESNDKLEIVEVSYQNPSPKYIIMGARLFYRQAAAGSRGIRFVN